MSYQVKVDPQVMKFLDRLQTKLATHIRSRLSLLENPFQHLEHYNGDYYKLRIGDYRALVDVDTTRKLVFVRYLDHRSRIYKR